MLGAVKLSQFVKLRRPLDSKSSCQWVRDCQAGKISGAYRLNGKGAWYVNLDTYDAAMQQLTSPKPIVVDDEIAKLGERLGLSSADMAMARRAAGVPA